MHGDHHGAELVGDARRQPRRPVRVVEQHHIGAQLAQRGAQPARPDRNPVPVRRDHLQRAALLGNDQVVLERSGPPGKRRLRLQVRPDPAAALSVEQRHVGDSQDPVLPAAPRAGGGGRTGEIVAALRFGMPLTFARN